MEKELMNAFEAAKKAADAAEVGGGPADEDRCVEALKRLRKMPVSTNDLVATQVGKRIRILTKHSRPRIQAAASDLLKLWKNIVIEETSNKEQNRSDSEDTTTAIRDTNCKISEAVVVEKSASNRVLSLVKFSEFQTIKIEQVMNTESRTVKIEGISMEEKQASVSKKHSVPSGPPKLNSMLKCNDPLRDKLRELLAETFVKVLAEATEDSRREVRHSISEINACDPIRVAVTVESTMFEKLGRSNGAHKVKYRSIMFNLKDAKNTIYVEGFSLDA